MPINDNCLFSANYSLLKPASVMHIKKVDSHISTSRVAMLLAYTYIHTCAHTHLQTRTYMLTYTREQVVNAIHKIKSHKRFQVRTC